MGDAFNLKINEKEIFEKNVSLLHYYLMKNIF